MLSALSAFNVKLFPFKSTTIGSCFDVCFSVYSVLTYLFSADTLLHVTVLSFVKVVVFLIGPSSDTGGLSSSGVNTYCPWPFSFLNVMSSRRLDALCAVSPSAISTLPVKFFSPSL